MALNIGKIRSFPVSLIDASTSDQRYPLGTVISILPEISNSVYARGYIYAQAGEALTASSSCSYVEGGKVFLNSTIGEVNGMTACCPQFDLAINTYGFFLGQGDGKFRVEGVDSLRSINTYIKATSDYDYWSLLPEGLSFAGSSGGWIEEQVPGDDTVRVVDAVLFGTNIKVLAS